MAVAGVSPGHPYPVRAMPESREDKFGTDPAGAGNPYYPEIGGVLKPTHPCKIRSSVTAPVAKKTCYLRLPVIHSYLPDLINNFVKWFRRIAYSSNINQIAYIKLRNK